MSCQRQLDRSYKCLIETRLFGRLTTSSRLVVGVTGARTEESCDNEGCAYRTDLITPGGGSTPFNDVFTDNGPVVQNTDRINTYLRQSDSTQFSVDDPVQLWVLLLIGGLGIMGLVIEVVMILAELFKSIASRR